MKLPSTLIRDLLVTQGLGAFGTTADWSLWIGKQPDHVSRCATIYDSGGLAANPKWLINYPSIQVRVRGNANDYEAAGNKAVELYNFLVGVPSQDVSGDRVVSITAIGDVAFLGWDDKQRPEFVFNLRMITEPTVSTATARETL